MKYITAIVVTILLLPIFTISIFAHAADSSTMLAYIGRDVNGNEIEKNVVEGVVTFNWLQMSALTGANESPVAIFNQLDKYGPKIDGYIENSITITNNSNKCEVTLNRFKERDVNLVIQYGIRYLYTARCEKDIENLMIENKAFNDQTLTQTNIIQLFRDNQAVAENYNGKVSFSTSTPQFTPDEYNKYESKETKDKILQYFNSLLSQENSWTIPLIFLTIFVMGALHSLEGGHNKVILGSLVIDKKIDLRQSVIFTIIFTLTHMSDIILLSVGLLFLDQYIDLYSAIPNITIITILVLLGISGYSLIKELRHIFAHRLNLDHHHDHDHDHMHDHHDHDHDHGIKKGQSVGKMITIAFISGLAPCVTGWSIFMLLFSTGRVNLVLPGMVFFGLGVFAVLMTYTFILHKSKGLILDKYSWITQYSSAISMGLVFISAIIQLISVI